jgi:hypothetical protein
MGAKYDDAIALCHQLAQADIWIELHPETQTLLLGPTARVQAYPALLRAAKTHKALLLETLQQTLACEVVSTPEAGRFQVETCPTCQQTTFVILAPRRLAVHRTVDGTAVCPGAAQAQEAVAETLMTRFITQRCLPRPGASLTWMALRGALEGWAREQGWLLPPRPYLLAWMDAHYTRLSPDPVYASWQGLTFTLEEWFGEEEAVPVAAPPARRSTKLVVKA